MKFYPLLILLLTTVTSIEGLGESVVDLSAVLGIFKGVADIFADVNTTEVQVSRMLGKWHQMYKAAINFDVHQANMYCHVAYFTKNLIMGHDGFSIDEAFHTTSKNGPIEIYRRDLQKVGPGEFWMNTEEYFYPRQFFIVKAGTSKSEDDVEFQFDLDNIDFSNDTEFVRVNNSLIFKGPSPTSENYKENKTDAKSKQDKELSPNSREDKNYTKSKPKENKEPYQYMIATDSNRLALMVYARDPEEYHKVYEKRVNSFLQKQGFGGYVFWNQPVPIYQNQDCHYPTEREIFVRRSLKNGGVDAEAVAAAAAANNAVVPLNSPPLQETLIQRLPSQFPLDSQQTPIRLPQFRLPAAQSPINSFRYINQRETGDGLVAAPQPQPAIPPQLLSPPLLNPLPSQANFGAVQQQQLQQQQQDTSLLSSLQYIPTDVLRRVFVG